MKISYKRNMNHSYMILSGDKKEDADSYLTRMLTENRIPGFLPVHVENLDGCALYYYDATSRHSLKSFFDLHSADRSLLELLFVSLNEALETLRDYLLPENGMILTPETIFLNAGRTEVSFCYYPENDRSFSEEMQEFSEILLPKLEHGDRQAVVMGYAFYQRCGNGDFSTGLFREMLEDMHLDEKEAPDATVQEMAEMGANDPDETESNDFFEEPEQKNAKKRGSWSRICARFSGGREKMSRRQRKEAKAREKEERREAKIKKKKEKRAQKEKAGKKAEERFEETDIRAEIEPYMYEDEAMPMAGQADERKGRWADCGQNEAAGAYAPCGDMEETTYLGETYGSVSEPGEKACDRAVLRELELPDSRGNGSGGLIFRLQKDHYVIGKNSLAADIILPSSAVSRVHAILQWKGDTYSLSDLNSKNGTRVGDRWLEGEEEVLLKEGDRIQIADLCFTYERMI